MIILSRIKNSTLKPTKRVFVSVLAICVALLTACQSTDELNKPFKNRAILADLVQGQEITEVENKNNDSAKQNNNTVAEFIMSKQQRALKLADLYQHILTVEPDEDVRTKIYYRLAQIDTQAYELQQDAEVDSKKMETTLVELVVSYQALIERYPNRPENEEIYYQLAKALSLQGKLHESLMQIELILSTYPESKYKAELHFRRGDIYYNLQHYTQALAEYQAVLQSPNSDKYYVNSVYMSGWALFKLNRLPESDQTFLALIDFIIAQEKIQPTELNFSFTDLNSRYVGLVNDIQRVLSISLSQQKQASSLVSLVKSYQGNEFKNNYLYLYQHLLFKNLADFLLGNGLAYDAELTYQSYLSFAPNTLWAARYTLILMDLYKSQGKNQAIQQLKLHYVKQFGMESEFWQQSLIATPSSVANKTVLMTEVLPNLLSFSYQYSRYLYAQAQAEQVVKNRVTAFTKTVQWLGTYLALAKLPEAHQLLSNQPSTIQPSNTQPTRLPLASNGLLADELLYADASFEAHLYQQALTSYEYIAYQAPIFTKKNSKKNSKNNEVAHELEMRKEAAYAATITIRQIIQERDQSNNKTNNQTLMIKRAQLDKAYIDNYPEDKRSLALAVQQAQYSVAIDDFKTMQYYCRFILQAYGVAVNSVEYETKTALIDHSKNFANLAPKELKEVQIASQLLANYWYQQADYSQAEASYYLALQYVNSNSATWSKMRELLASSIYFQGQHAAKSDPLLAVEHYLRLGKQIPESTYRIGAEFDAANLLFTQEKWQAAIDVFTAYQQRYPAHENSSTIPVKLAKAYENLAQWEMAAAQYLAIVKLAQSTPALGTNALTNLSDTSASELAREALYSAAALYLKAENLNKAISTFRAYAHSYPEPFDIAQEVRFKMSQFYQQTKEPNKEYYWYRKIVQFHEQKFNSKTREADSRALYLASIATLELGKAHQQTFKSVKLTLPLNKSLARKQKAMKSAIDYYKKLLSFQLAEFVPQGTYNLAQMYRQLSQDVMTSQRPKALDELALEEYNLLLEEMIYPFEEKAIEIHTNNAQRAWQNIYDEWVMKSFAALAELEPALYNRTHHGTNRVSKNSKNSKNSKKEGEIHAIHTLH